MLAADCQMRWWKVGSGSGIWNRCRCGEELKQAESVIIFLVGEYKATKLKGTK